MNITISLVEKLIARQFPEFAHLPIRSVKIQGHDNRTFRLGEEMLVRMPTAEAYALKVPKEQEFLPRLAPHLSIPIPVPLKTGRSSEDYPFNFSIYKWLEGESANSLQVGEENLEQITLDLANFLKELQRIDSVGGLAPGLHNWYRGDHVSVYDKGAHDQILQLRHIINSDAALALWKKALESKWHGNPVCIHGDFTAGNILLQDGKLSGIIDFGGMAVGDPACDLVIAWTFLKNKSRDIFKKQMELDADTWMRARGWALWKATYELCQIKDKASQDALKQKQIIEEVIVEDIA